jgi:hypothetical protein
MPEYNYGYRFLLVAFIVGLNGFFSASEVALLSSRRSRIQQLADEGDNGAKAALASRWPAWDWVGRARRQFSICSAARCSLSPAR